jgi:hypothetical protein
MTGKAERLYPINSHGSYDFYAGVTADKTQVLMGLFCPDLVAFFFDPEGDLIKVETRPLPFFQHVPPPYDIYDGRIQLLLDDWMSDLGIQPTTIRVKRFFSQELCIGIEDYPGHFQEILSDSEASKEEKDDIVHSMTLWDQDLQFVLLWGNDYWLDESGYVVSS